MDSVINNAYISTYADSLSKIICDRYFEENNSINGNEILELTEINQLNLLIIKNLFSRWEQESEKLKSPYFDYSNDEVKNALNDLLNTLSRNISIKKKYFVPLVKAAIRDILMLIYSPYDFFKAEWVTLNNPFNQLQIQNRKKFIKINASLFDSFLSAMQETGKESFSHDEAFKLFDQVCSNISFSPDEPKDIFIMISGMLPLDEDQIYNDNNDENKSGDSAEREFNDTQPIHEQYYEEKETVADTLKTEDKNTILDYHQNQKIDSLRKNISIHQKFMFLRELFNNDDAYFDKVVNFIDNASNREDALNYLEEEFFADLKWNRDNETVQEFMAVFEKKFD